MIPSALVPNVETLGYCQESLRDENEILRESVVWHGLPAFRDSNSVSSDKSVRQSFVEKGDSSGIVDPGYPKTEVTGLYSACERATEWLIYFMVVFSPWAFGTTQAWSIEVMNCAGYLLGGLLAAKWLLRWSKSLSENYRGGVAADVRRRIPGPKSHDLPPPHVGGYNFQTRSRSWPARLLAGLTVLILGYCLISAVNDRATFLRSEFRFAYHEYLPWLPHSYDSISTWQTFWNYLGLALAFWAVADWVRAGAAVDRDEQSRKHSGGEPGSGNSPTRMSALPGRLPARLRGLLWVLCINGALLALEGILQRTSGSGKLLWLVEPRINKEAATQFGPYSHRSKPAQ